MKKEIGELVQYVKDWANFHYNDGGWDVIVECWADKDILKVLTRDNATISVLAQLVRVTDSGVEPVKKGN